MLVTNLREFELVGPGYVSSEQTLEAFRVANSEAEFARRLERPRLFARDVGAGLSEYLCRALSYRAALVEPKDVAWLLASYARDGLARVETGGDSPSLAAVRAALEDALGVRFEGERGARFFPSTLVPTLFYGACLTSTEAEVMMGWMQSIAVENQQVSSWRACLTAPRRNSLYEKPLAAPTDRPAHTVAVAITVAFGGAGSVYRQTGMQAARALSADAGRPGPPPAIPAAHPTTRQERRARITGPTRRQLPKSTELGVQNDTQGTLGARGVNPAESHAARVTQLTLTGRPRCGREGSQGAVIQ